MQESATFEGESLKIGYRGSRFLEYTELSHFTALFPGKLQRKLTKAYNARAELQLLLKPLSLASLFITLRFMERCQKHYKSTCRYSLLCR